MKPAKYVVEFIGTFVFVFTIAMCVIEPGGAGVLAPIAIGTILAAMIYAGGHISGAHYNPAVTIAILLRGKCPAADVAPYIIAQLAAAAAAAGLTLFLKDSPDITPLAVEPLPAFIAEAIFTFALAFVILMVATTKATQGNSYFGFAIGITVLVGAVTVGPISGGAFNPAVALALGITGLVEWADLWIHLVAQIVGAVLAVAAFKATTIGDDDPRAPAP